MNHDKQSAASTGTVTFELHFTIRELSELWRFDVATVRRWFHDEPGVLVHGKTGRRDGQRDYLSMRIPASVAQRVYLRHTR